MQKIIVFIIVGIAVFYLGYKFLVKKKHAKCDDCGLSTNNSTKK